MFFIFKTIYPLMAYETELAVPSYIVSHVMGRRIKMINEDTQEEITYRETIYNLSDVFNVDIKYLYNLEKFIISGSQENADKVVIELEHIKQKKIDEKLKLDTELAERQRQKEELGYYPEDMDDEGFLCPNTHKYGKRQEIKKLERQIKAEVKAIEKNKKEKQIETKKTNNLFIDRNNTYHLLTIDDDDSSQLVQLKLNYENSKNIIKDEIMKLEKRYNTMESKLIQAEKDKIYKLKHHDTDSETKLDTSIVDSKIIKLRKELIRIENKLESCDFNYDMSFEDYEKQLNNPTESNHHIMTEAELDKLVDASVDYIESEVDKQVNENKANRKTDSLDKQIENEIGQFLEGNFPRNRTHYKRVRHKEGNSNNTKSESWTHIKENHKRDNIKHSNPKTRQHSRTHEHFSEKDLEDEIDNSKRIPTDHIKDKLCELIGLDQSDIPPLVSDNGEV